MGKTAKIVVSAASIFVVIAGVVAYIVYFDVLGSDLPRYAPPGTDEIEYTNFKKFSRTRIFRAFQKTIEYEKMVEDAKKDGFDPEKIFQFELCVFRNRNAAMDGKEDDLAMTEVSRGGPTEAFFRKRLKEGPKNVADAEKKAAEAKKKAAEEGRKPGDLEIFVPKFSSGKIGGKEAFTSEGYGGDKKVSILLGKNMVQSSFGIGGRKPPVSAPLKKESTIATRAIDTSALYSYAWVVNIPENYRKKLSDHEKSAAIGLKIVRVNVYESGSSDIEVKAEFIYENADQAKTAQKFLEALRRKYVGQKDFRICDCLFIDGKSGAEILGSAKVGCTGKKVVATAKFSQNTIARRIEENDKERRQSKK